MNGIQEFVENDEFSPDEIPEKRDLTSFIQTISLMTDMDMVMKTKKKL